MKISKKRLREIIKEEIDWSQEDKIYRGLDAKGWEQTDKSPEELKRALQKVFDVCQEALQATDPMDGDSVAQEVLEAIEHLL